MRRPNGLLALLAGVVLTAFLPVDDAVAVEAPATDFVSREAARRNIRQIIDVNFEYALRDRAAGECGAFQRTVNFLREWSDADKVRKTALELGTRLRTDERLELTQYAKDKWAELRALDCPPKGQTAADAGQSGISVSAGGGFGSVWVPTIPGGLTIDGDREAPVARSENRLDGSSFNFEVGVPLGGPPLSDNGIYFGFQRTDANGSSHGSVAPGDTEVGFVYAAPDPDGEFPSVFGTFGQFANIETEIDLTSLSASLRGEFNIFPSSWQGQASIGMRYVNLDRTDRTTLSAPEDEDLSLTNRSNLDTDFFGPELGVAVERRQDGVSYFTPNIVGFRAAVAFVGSDTSATVRSSSTFADTLTAKSNDNDFSLILSAGLNLSWNVSRHVAVQAYANVEHFTDVPYTLAPGIGVGAGILYDDMTDATVGLGLKFDW